MARSMWNGAITIAAVAIPVKVFAATSPKNPRFRELHAKDGAPIEHRRVSAKTGREVPSERIVKGYQTSSGHYVVLTGDEIRAAEQPQRKSIDIEAFVPAEQIDPIYYDRAYHLGAGDDGRDAFAALLAAIERTGLVGIGRVVLRTKEQLVAIRAGDGVLRMSTMRFHDELVRPRDIDVAKPDRTPTKRELEMAEQLVGGLEQDFDPGDAADEYRKRVEKYARAKKRGKVPDLPAVEEPEPSDDLLAALQASLDGGDGNR